MPKEASKADHKRMITPHHLSLQHEEEEEEEIHQSSQMRLIRWNTNTRIEDPSTNLETVIIGEMRKSS